MQCHVTGKQVPVCKTSRQLHTPAPSPTTTSAICIITSSTSLFHIASALFPTHPTLHLPSWTASLSCHSPVSLARRCQSTSVLLLNYSRAILTIDSLLKEGKYSDLTITCGDDSYAVHKAIVCSRSPFFAACCDGDFKVGYSTSSQVLAHCLQEAKSGVVDLPDDDPLAVKMMIRYLYTGTYPTPSKSAPNGTY